MEPAKKPWARLVDKEKTYPLYNEKCLLGKGEYCDIRIEHPKLCRQHCAFAKTGHTLKMFSQRAITINDQNYDGTMEPYTLSKGNIINILPDLTLKFEIIDEFESTHQNGGNQKIVLYQSMNRSIIRRNQTRKLNQLEQTKVILEDITCSICDEIIFQAVATYPCNHHFCGGCLSIWQRKNPKDCPNCRSHIEGVTKNHLVNNIVEKYLSKHPGATKLPQDKEKLSDANVFYNRPQQQPLQKRGRLSSPQQRPNQAVAGNNTTNQNNQQQPPLNQVNTIQVRQQQFNIIHPVQIQGMQSRQQYNIHPLQQQTYKESIEQYMKQQNESREQYERSEDYQRREQQRQLLVQIAQQQVPKVQQEQKAQPPRSQPRITPPQKLIVRNSKSIEIDQKMLQNKQPQKIEQQAPRIQQIVINAPHQNPKMIAVKSVSPLQQSNINIASKNSQDSKQINQSITQVNIGNIPPSQIQQQQAPPQQKPPVYIPPLNQIVNQNHQNNIDKKCEFCLGKYHQKCQQNQQHLPCIKCAQMLPVKDLKRQEWYYHCCQICEALFCDKCYRMYTENKEINLLKDFTTQSLASIQSFNRHDRDRLLTFIRYNGQAFITKFMLSKFIEKKSFYWKNIQLHPDSLICKNCHPEVLCHLVVLFVSEKQIDNYYIPNCYQGLDCDKQFKDAQHQRSYNHICYRI